MSATEIIFVLTGILTIYLGYLIRFKGKVSLLAGYDASKVRDVVGLARWSGDHVILMGVFQSASVSLMPYTTFGSITIFIAPTIVLAFNMAWGMSRYMR